MTIRETFERLRSRDEAGLACYLMGGYPTLDASMRNIRAAVEGGADLIEVGIPFSDPIADGPTIQAASHEALVAGASLRRILEGLAAQRFDVPIVIMTYLNPLLALGRDRIGADFALSGVSGLIVPDLPMEESDEWTPLLSDAGISLIQLAAPTSTDDRLREIGKRSEGFVYAVSLTGTTGARRELSSELPAFLKRAKQLTAKPIAVGFGISTPEQIRSLREHADAVVVGSRLVDAIRQNEDLCGLVKTLKAATRSA